MSGISISLFTALLTIIISLFVAVLIKLMGAVLGRLSKSEHHPSETATGLHAVVEAAPVEESDVAAAIAITKSLQKPFPLNY
jgi:Na+-transporting methylmalonyl-CoA/oxaloacetate decarboxylase gamma subunit